MASPVINLTKKFNQDNSEIVSESRIIVVNIFDQKAGFSVHVISQVTKISDGEIELFQAITSGCERKYITGLAKKRRENHFFGIKILMEGREGIGWKKK